MRALSSIVALLPEPPFARYIRVQYPGRPVDSACGHVVPFTDLDSTPRVVFVLVVLYLGDEAGSHSHSGATYRKCGRSLRPTEMAPESSTGTSTASITCGAKAIVFIGTVYACPPISYPEAMIASTPLSAAFRAWWRAPTWWIYTSPTSYRRRVCPPGPRADVMR